jgi:putative membrane protein
MEERTHRHHHRRGTPLPATIKKNDKLAYILIFTVSIIVFAAVVFLKKVTIDVNLGFDKHIFARLNALINSFVALLLLGSLFAVKDKRYRTHRKLMLWAIGFSVLFLISYICHHLFTGETTYGGSGLPKLVYYFILITHIVLAGIILPFILFTAYRGLTADYHRHKKLARITWPLWLYVAVTGVIVFLMISPYYN